jgi:hypothetical protein
MIYFIEQDWLEAIRGSSFYYPAAGSDHTEPIRALSNYVSQFTFCDLLYPPGLELPNAIPDSATPPEMELIGPLDAKLESRKDKTGRSYRYLKPSWRQETYRRPDMPALRITRRRGFGQMGLQELGEASLGVFMHRGDSSGEGGSNLYFLSDKKSRHEPCGHLFSKIEIRLKDQALIIADGSNCCFPFVKSYHNSSTSGRDAYSELQSRKVVHGQFQWRCVGWLTPRNGPTLVWGLSRDCA